MSNEAGITSGNTNANTPVLMKKGKNAVANAHGIPTCHNKGVSRVEGRNTVKNTFDTMFDV